MKLYRMLDTVACQGCKRPHSAALSSTCGAEVCLECGHHNGLARCFCGWSASGGDGRRELIEMGENVEEE